MSAKDATLQRTDSHHISDDNYSSRANGISREEVYLYFSAKWRGQPVSVTMSADKYAHSSGMSDWRVYATEAHIEDPDKNGGRGAPVTDTARRALSKLCQPMVIEWLASDAYAASFQAALAHMVMRKFRDDYSAARRVREALATFRSRLAPAAFKAIGDTLTAYEAYEAAQARAFEVISS